LRLKPVPNLVCLRIQYTLEAIADYHRFV
jgi:hypothetical protein